MIFLNYNNINLAYLSKFENSFACLFKEPYQNKIRIYHSLAGAISIIYITINKNNTLSRNFNLKLIILEVKHIKQI